MRLCNITPGVCLLQTPFKQSKIVKKVTALDGGLFVLSSTLHLIHYITLIVPKIVFFINSLVIVFLREMHKQEFPGRAMEDHFG